MSINNNLDSILDNLFAQQVRQHQVLHLQRLRNKKTGEIELNRARPQALLQLAQSSSDFNWHMWFNMIRLPHWRMHLFSALEQDFNDPKSQGSHARQSLQNLFVKLAALKMSQKGAGSKDQRKTAKKIIKHLFKNSGTRQFILDLVYDEKDSALKEAVISVAQKNYYFARELLQAIAKDKRVEHPTLKQNNQLQQLLLAVNKFARQDFAVSWWQSLLSGLIRWFNPDYSSPADLLQLKIEASLKFPAQHIIPQDPGTQQTNKQLAKNTATLSSGNEASVNQVPNNKRKRFDDDTQQTHKQFAKRRKIALEEKLPKPDLAAFKAKHIVPSLLAQSPSPHTQRSGNDSLLAASPSPYVARTTPTDEIAIQQQQQVQQIALIALQAVQESKQNQQETEKPTQQTLSGNNAANQLALSPSPAPKRGTNNRSQPSKISTNTAIYFTPVKKGVKKQSRSLNNKENNPPQDENIMQTADRNNKKGDYLVKTPEQQKSTSANSCRFDFNSQQLPSTFDPLSLSPSPYCN